VEIENFEDGTDKFTVHADHIIGQNHKQLHSKFQHHGTCSAAAFVIAQQYSFATFVSLHFRSRKEKFGARLKNVIHDFRFF
jgi:hypothetical protein